MRSISSHVNFRPFFTYFTKFLASPKGANFPCRGAWFMVTFQDQYNHNLPSFDKRMSQITLRKGEEKSGHTIMADVWGNGELIYGTSSKKLKETAYEKKIR